MSFVKFLILLPLIAQLIYATKQTVSGSAPCIQTAIDKSSEGDTVFINNGNYHESITLKYGITLLGESSIGTVISGNRREPVITSADNTLIKRLTIQNGTIGILSENNALSIEEVIARNNTETGIHCLISLPNIYNCVIRGNRWSGILCESARSIKTSIMHNIIAENGYSGISLEGQCEILILNNVLFSNKRFGIWGVEESRKSRIVYNDFFGNRSTVNNYLIRDPSNILDDPGYLLNKAGVDYFSSSTIVLKGKGKDGATIGLIGEEVLSQKLTDPDEDKLSGQNDKCPSFPEDLDGFEDSDGCPEFDNDQDGIFDVQDACPESTEDYDGFKDDDGCPDNDNDKDGIPDSSDICKDTPETVNAYKDTDGCPDEVSPSAAIPVPSTPAIDTLKH